LRLPRPEHHGSRNTAAEEHYPTQNQGDDQRSLTGIFARFLVFAWGSLCRPALLFFLEFLGEFVHELLVEILGRGGRLIRLVSWYTKGGLAFRTLDASSRLEASTSLEVGIA
jgi:hypothetical protein